MPNSTSGKELELAGPDAPTLLEFPAPDSWLEALDPDARSRLPITLKHLSNLLCRKPTRPVPRITEGVFGMATTDRKESSQTEIVSVWLGIYGLRSFEVTVFSSGLYVRLLSIGVTLDGPRPLEAASPPEPPVPLPPDELPLDVAAAAAAGSR